MIDSGRILEDLGRPLFAAMVKGDVMFRNELYSPKSKQVPVAIFRRPSAVDPEQGPAEFELFVWGVALLQVMQCRSVASAPSGNQPEPS